MADETVKSDAESAIGHHAVPVTEIFTSAEVSGVALGNGLELLTLNQGFEALIDWKSSLHVYGSEEPLIRATAYYTGSSPDDERRFWREMAEAVKKAELLKSELKAFLAIANRFPKPRPF